MAEMTRKIGSDLNAGKHLLSASSPDKAVAFLLSDVPWHHSASGQYSGKVLYPGGSITFSVNAPEGLMATAEDINFFLYLIGQTSDRVSQGDILDGEMSITLKGYKEDTQQNYSVDLDQLITSSLRRLQATQFKLDIEDQRMGTLQIFSLVSSFDYTYELVDGQNRVTGFRIRLADFPQHLLSKKSLPSSVVAVRTVSPASRRLPDSKNSVDQV